jgi:hypothetical protein
VRKIATVIVTVMIYELTCNHTHGFLSRAFGESESFAPAPSWEEKATSAGSERALSDPSNSAFGCQKTVWAEKSL